MTVTNNTITGTGEVVGGGVFVMGASVVSDSTIANNTALVVGGAFFNGVALITNTTFSGNTASMADSGGAYFGDTASVTNASFSTIRPTARAAGRILMARPLSWRLASPTIARLAALCRLAAGRSLML